MASSLPTFRTELRTLILARTVIADAKLKVYKYLDPDAEGKRWIEMTRAVLDHTWQSMDKRKELFNLRVNVWNQIVGKGDKAATKAETNTLAWADEIAAVLKADKTVSGTVTIATWVAGQVDNQINDAGRWCLYEGHIEVTSFGV